MPDVQVAQIHTDGDISQLLTSSPLDTLSSATTHYSQEQGKDPEILKLHQFLSHRKLPDDPQQAKKIATQAFQFALLHDIVYFIDAKRDAVSSHTSTCPADGGKPQWTIFRTLFGREVVQGPGSTLMVTIGVL